MSKQQPSIAAHWGATTASDPVLFEQAVRPWDLLCIPTSGGVFDYRMSYVRMPNITFYRETYANRVTIKGIAPPGMLAFAVPLGPGQDSTFWGAAPEKPGFPCVMSGVLDVVMSNGRDHFVVLIAVDLLQRALPANVADHLNRAADKHFIPASTEDLQQFGAWLLRCLKTVSEYPQMLQQPLTLQTLEQDLLQQLTNSLSCTHSAAPRPPISVRQRALNRALNYLYADTHNDLAITDLCQIAGASQRTLEYAFRETFGMTPLQFLRLRRLHAVRLDLLTAHPVKNRTVNEIAFAHGFYELGRFAGFYKQVFGELPSVTLQRSRTSNLS